MHPPGLYCTQHQYHLQQPDAQVDSNCFAGCMTHDSWVLPLGALHVTDRWFQMQSVVVHTRTCLPGTTQFCGLLASSFGARPSAFSIAHNDVMPITMPFSNSTVHPSRQLRSGLLHLTLQQVQLIPQPADAMVPNCTEMRKRQSFDSYFIVWPQQEPDGHQLRNSTAVHDIIAPNGAANFIGHTSHITHHGTPQLLENDTSCQAKTPVRLPSGACSLNKGLLSDHSQTRIAARTAHAVSRLTGC